MLCTGTFLVSSVPALVLFDSGASRSFVSLAFSQHISISREALIRPLRVSIADERAVYATELIRGCVLDIFGVEFPIHLVPIAMGDACVIVGMDWLSRFGAVINCEWQLVTIRDPSGGVLTVYDEGTRPNSAFCSAARARQSLQQGCSGFVAYVVDTRVGVERPSSVEEVPIVREFPDVFPEELPSVPPERQVEFHIDLIMGAAPIGKAPYRLAPPEMQELFSQLQELP